MKSKKKVNYVDNKKLYSEMVKYLNSLEESKKNNTTPPRVSEYIGYAIQQIAYGLSKNSNFSSYSFKEDMIFDGIENCLRYIHNFNPNKTNNPFSYFTTIIYYAFLRRIEKEKKQQYVKYKSMLNGMINNDLYVTQEEDVVYLNSLYDKESIDRMTDTINKFEEKNKTKKKSKIGIENFIREEDEQI